METHHAPAHLRSSAAGRRWRALAFGLAMVGATHAVQANLLTNGSFEEPIVQPGSFRNFAAGSAEITGWTVVGVDSSLVSGTFMQSGVTFQAQSGSQWIDLAGVTSNNKLSGVTQSVSTVAGAMYELTFHVAAALAGGLFFPATVDLSIDGGARTSYLNPAAPTTMLDWKLFTVEFMATGSATSLTFYNGSEVNNFLGGLDNVSLVGLAVTTPIPEPAEWALMGLGVVVLGEMRRRRKATERV